MRKIILTTLDGTLTESLLAERVGQKFAGSTRDFAEGLAAFRDKRPPNYTGS
jgi:2-(1,2-epoxy-1,2-dihydrophenyl)acetyl-CoA isomerase